MTDQTPPIDAADVTFAAAGAGRLDALFIYADNGFSDEEIDLERDDGDQPIVLRDDDLMVIRYDGERPQRISEALVMCACAQYQVRLYDGISREVCPICGFILEIAGGVILIRRPT